VKFFFWGRWLAKRASALVPMELAILPRPHSDSRLNPLIYGFTLPWLTPDTGRALDNSTTWVSPTSLSMIYRIGLPRLLYPLAIRLLCIPHLNLWLRQHIKMGGPISIPQIERKASLTQRLIWMPHFKLRLRHHLKTGGTTSIP
jgi:hypothetical protein